jgi:hypothetical protein
MNLRIRTPAPRPSSVQTVATPTALPQIHEILKIKIQNKSNIMSTESYSPLRDICLRRYSVCCPRVQSVCYWWWCQYRLITFTPTLLSNGYWWQSSRGVKLTTNLQPLPRSGKCGSIRVHSLPPSPHTSSWRSTWLVEHKDNYTIPVIIAVYACSLFMTGSYLKIITVS